MSLDADLTNASRETLLMVIAEQQTALSEQQATIDELLRRIGDPERRVLPGGRQLRPTKLDKIKNLHAEVRSIPLIS